MPGSVPDSEREGFSQSRLEQECGSRFILLARLSGLEEGRRRRRPLRATRRLFHSFSFLVLLLLRLRESWTKVHVRKIIPSWPPSHLRYEGSLPFLPRERPSSPCSPSATLLGSRSVPLSSENIGCCDFSLCVRARKERRAVRTRRRTTRKRTRTEAHECRPTNASDHERERVVAP